MARTSRVGMRLLPFLIGWAESTLGQTPPTISGIIWPQRPALNINEYPKCQQDYISKVHDYEKAAAGRSCRSLLEEFNRFSLNGFATDVQEYLRRILELDRSVRTGRYDYNLKVSAQNYVAGELAAFRSRRNDGDAGGSDLRVYYRFYSRYLDDVSEQTRVVRHYSPGWDR